MKRHKGLALLFSLIAGPAFAQTIEPVAPASLHDFEHALPMRVGGRTAQGQPKGMVLRQWPGTYFETAFTGADIGFRVGQGDVRLKVALDDQPAVSLLKPAAGLYRLTGVAPGAHRLRIDVVSEDQDMATGFGGFFSAAATQPLPIATRSRQIEFIGDSHTVGYGNTSAKRACSAQEIFATTDTSQGVAPLVAARYHADYQVNAISGRGIVRNYGGGAGDPVPVAYPFVLFDKAQRYADPDWHPQVIVIALGTNDFSTPLKPGERWPTREALHRDYEQTYVDFVHGLRARNPAAYIVLWATDVFDGEIAAEVDKVAKTLKAEGETRLAFVPMAGLAMDACDSHPDLADDAAIARSIDAALDAQPAIWPGASQ